MIPLEIGNGAHYAVPSLSTSPTQEAAPRTQVRIWQSGRTPPPMQLSALQHPPAGPNSLADGDAALQDIAAMFASHEATAEVPARPRLARQVSGPAPEPGPETEPEAEPGRGRWTLYTLGLVACRAVQGAAGTFLGRVAQGAVLAWSGSPQTPEEVDDKHLVIGVVVNQIVGVLEAARAGMHGFNAARNARTYAHGMLGQPAPAPRSLDLQAGMMNNFAGTPSVQAGRMRCALTGAVLALTSYGLATHTSWRALAHTGQALPGKPDAYRALWASNGNAAYAFTRESFNLLADMAGWVAHSAPLRWQGAVAVTAQYEASALIQAQLRRTLDVRESSGLDWRWIAISSGAEAVDVAAVAAASRVQSPEQPARLLFGRLNESTNEPAPSGGFTLLGSLQRVAQRGASRHLVGEVTQVIPPEIAALRATLTGIDVASRQALDNVARWTGSGLQGFTHVREMAWQAEDAARRQTSDLWPSHEAPGLRAEAVLDRAVRLTRRSNATGGLEPEAARAPTAQAPGLHRRDRPGDSPV